LCLSSIVGQEAEHAPKNKIGPKEQKNTPYKGLWTKMAKEK